MHREIKQFLSTLLIFFPYLKEKYEASININNGQVLVTVIIEDIFMVEITRLLKENTNTDLLGKIFDYFEEVSNCKDSHLLNIFSVTVLENLGNDKNILKTAYKYMGSKTRKLQIKADKSIGRFV